MCVIGYVKFLSGYKNIFFSMMVFCICALVSMRWIDFHSAAQKKLIAEEALLSQVKTKIVTIQSLQKTNQKSSVSFVNHFNFLKHSLENSKLASSIEVVKDTADAQVKLVFSAVNFDELMRCLLTIVQRTSFRIESLTITRENQRGLVNASLFLRT